LKLNGIKNGQTLADRRRFAGRTTSEQLLKSRSSAGSRGTSVGPAHMNISRRCVFGTSGKVKKSRRGRFTEPQQPFVFAAAQST
jgi:hypothetical protein